jgi:hypothetical protein
MVDTPLTMTVHNLPTPGAPSVQRQVSGRWKMMAVLLVCAAPIIASYVTFYVVRPGAQRNYGTLIPLANPAPELSASTKMNELPDIKAVALDGTVSNLRAFRGQWLLVSVAGGACDAACQQRIYLQRQMRESLGRDKDRLDRLWLITDEQPVASTLVSQVQAANVDAYALRVSQAALAQWLKPDAGQQLSDHLYLVDPIGRWMMRFPADLDPTKAKRDLERLLRASVSWDRAGREKEVQP